MSSFKWLIIFSLIFLIFLLRFWQATLPKTGDQWISFYNNRDFLQLKGVVADWPQVKGEKQVFSVSDLTVTTCGRTHECAPTKANLKSAGGKVLVTTRLYPRYSYGQVLRLEGKIVDPPVFDEFDYREYLTVDGIYSLMSFPKLAVLAEQPAARFLLTKPIYDFRYRLESMINESLVEPHASLLAGILFGAKRDFSNEFLGKLRNAGVMHVIVASGYNVSVVLGLIGYLSFLIGRRLNIILSLLFALIYSVMTGLQPPIIRAVIMASGASLAEIFGRQKLGLLWLFFSAYLMLIWNPLWIKSISFQLSLLATLGMLTLQPVFENLLSSLSNLRQMSFLKGKWFKKLMGEPLVTTLAVQFLTLPLVFYSFQKISLIGFLVNPLVLWTVPLSMFGGIVMVAVGLFSSQLAYLTGLFVWLPLEFFVKAVGLFG